MILPFPSLPRNAGAIFLVSYALFAAGQLLAADQELIVNGDFASGMQGWTIESGRGSVPGDHLIVASGDSGQGIISQEVAVKPNTIYKVSVDFHFQPGIEDDWSVGIVEIWPEGTTTEAENEARLGRFVFKTRKAQNGGPENSEWRTGDITFDSGTNSEIVLRLKSHPNSTDQTHWNNISMKLE